MFHCTNCDMWETIEWSDGETPQTRAAFYGVKPPPLVRFQLVRVLPAFTDESGQEWCEVHEGTHIQARCNKLVDQYNSGWISYASLSRRLSEANP
jgi:hypothetical protein